MKAHSETAPGTASGGSTRRHRLAMGAASLFILGCLGLQAVAMLDRHLGPFRPAPYQWPFIDYPMYSYAHYEGDTIPRPVVVGLRADGDPVVIEPEDFGLLYFFYRQGPVRAIERGDRERARLFADRYAELRGVELTRLELRHRPVVVERDGFHFAPEHTVAAVSLAGEESR